MLRSWAFTTTTTIRRMSTGTRSFADAIDALNSCQSNFATLEMIRKTKQNTNTNTNDMAIPQMLEWARRAGYSDVGVFDRLNVIHVTGTKGKGSTCAFVQSILNQYQQTQSGKLQKIGLYTSPHLKSVRERIRINGEPISEEKFTKYFFEVWDQVESTQSDLDKFPEAAPGAKPGYFRFLTLLSFHAFMREGVDTAIYEVGIGGEYDSTNIIRNPSTTGVSSLGIDHVNVLGNTIESISWNKGGIYKSSAPAFSVAQPKEALQVLKQRADERDTDFKVVGDLTYGINLGLHGKFQHINASLAVKLAESHLVKQGFEVDLSNGLPDKFVKGLEQANWPGRCQTINDTTSNIQWLLDGAHTKESITEAANWYAEVVQPEATKVLLFNQQTRDANALVGTLHGVLSKHGIQFDHAMFTTNVTYAHGYSGELKSLNVSTESVDALVVQKALSQAWSELDDKAQRHVCPNIQEAIASIKALSPNEHVQVFITGSLHLVGGFLAVHEHSDN